MRHSKLAVLLVASVMVAAAAVTSADAGVGGCRLGPCGGKESVAVNPGRGRSADVLDALNVILPRTVVEGIRIFLGRGRDTRPVDPPSGGPTIEGVGGCRFTCGPQ